MAVSSLPAPDVEADRFLVTTGAVLPSRLGIEPGAGLELVRVVVDERIRIGVEDQVDGGQRFIVRPSMRLAMSPSESPALTW